MTATKISIDIRRLRAKDKVDLIRILFIEAGASGKSTADVVKKLANLSGLTLAEMCVQMYQETCTAREKLAELREKTTITTYEGLKR